MAGMVFTSSFWDDVRGLSIKWRLLSHFLAAGLILYFASPGLHAWWMLVILLFGIVWSSNLFNFMDGADGMAGGMALSGFLFYGLAALGQDNVPIALESLSIATASLAFLLFNFQPARIFMGDAGAIPLGFLAASLGLHGWAQHAWPSWFPLLVFLPFIADSTVTLIKRLTKGESLLEAHRSHYYQRLILMGWSHRKLALWAYGLMIVAGISATIGLTLSLQNLLGTFIFWFCLIGLIMICIDRKWQRFAKTHNQAVVTDFFQHKPESIE
ncbi:MAG: glycosyl transferase [Sulfuricellaceae bacterium]|nr:glycosyl transferase [Sulfuricellaceae bacterium]